MIWWYPTIYKNETIYLSALSNEANIIFDFLHWTTIDRKFPKCYDYFCRLLKYNVPQFVRLGLQTIIWWFIFTWFYSIWYVCTNSLLNHIKNKTITVGLLFCLIRWFQNSSNCINNITNIHNIHIFIINKFCCTDVPLLSNPIL